MDIKIIEIEPVTRRVYFKMSPNLITGFDKLIQIFVLALLDEPGKDVFFPDEGGAIPSLIGQNIDSSDTNAVIADITDKVRRTERQVKQNQIGLVLDPAEKLRDVRIVDIRANPTQVDEYFVVLRLINESGRQSDLVV